MRTLFIQWDLLSLFGIAIKHSFCVCTNILEGLHVYLYCYYNEYPVKQTAEDFHFFSVFLLLLEKLVSAYCALIYFWISGPNLSMEGG